MTRLAAQAPGRASFREEKHLAALDGTLVSTGHLEIHGRDLVKTTDWPQQERLEIDGDRLVITEGNAPPRVIDTHQAPQLGVLIDAIRAPLLGDAAALRRTFAITVGGTMAAWTIDLVPRGAEAGKLLRRAVLRGHGGTLDRLTLLQANGDEQDMTITPG